MTKKSQTLANKKDVRTLFKTGKRVSKFPIQLVYLPNQTQLNRYLFCTDRSCKTAVKRNRIKRIQRVLMREFPICGLDIAIISGFSLNSIEHQQRVKLIRLLAKKIHGE